jgi:hypothetical protein
MQAMRKGLRCVLVLLLIFAVNGFATLPSAVNVKELSSLSIPKADCRQEEQTFLTFPEWFLVFSPADYADLLQKKHSSEFPWFGHIAEFWKVYGKVIDKTHKYPFNSEYHIMINVIGLSTTIEYGLKGSYETLIGRLTEATAPVNATPEDQLAAKVAKEYLEFIRVRPWYEFDFVSPLRELWSSTPLTGSYVLRKWERRYLLSTEWSVKALYAALMEWAAHSSFDVPKTDTLSVLKQVPESVLKQHPEIRLQARQGDDAVLALPRYQAFTESSQGLAKQGAVFTQIACNQGPILVSLISDVAAPLPKHAELLFKQSILSRPGMERRVITVPVQRLSATLNAEQEVEHVFDY